MTLTVAATQMRCSWDMEDNLNKAERLIREAAAQGAQVILPQENVGLHFFGFMDWKPEHFRLAQGLDGPIVRHMQTLARDLGVVIPVNFFEKANNAYFNTNAMIDADGAVLGSTARRTSPAGRRGASRRYTRAMAIPGSRCSRPPMARWARRSAGTSGSRNRPGSWR